MVSNEIKELVERYFYQGFTYRLIHYLLEKDHHCTISYLQKKVIPSLGLRRRGSFTRDFDDVLAHSLIELNNGIGGPEQLRRTLAMKYRLRITRELVRIIDGEGLERRRKNRLRRRLYISKGPNYTWHMDGYDKLAPYGICIHGCIDGFSRKVIWLKTGLTNRRPEVIGEYFLQGVTEVGGFPRTVRGDHGTENCLVARIQCQVLASEKAFRYGRSVSNQRIERWWGYLRNTRSDFWMHQFKQLQEADLLCRENTIHRLCLQFSFLPFIQKQLDEIKDIWNTHSIRNQRNGDCFPGIPDVLYTQPELYGVQDFLTPVTDNVIQQCRQRCSNNFLAMDEDFIIVAYDLVFKLGLPNPEIIDSFDDAKNLYLILVSLFENAL